MVLGSSGKSGKAYTRDFVQLYERLYITLHLQSWHMEKPQGALLLFPGAKRSITRTSNSQWGGYFLVQVSLCLIQLPPCSIQCPSSSWGAVHRQIANFTLPRQKSSFSLDWADCVLPTFREILSGPLTVMTRASLLSIERGVLQNLNESQYSTQWMLCFFSY